MNVTVDDVMVKRVVTATPEETVGEVRGRMQQRGVHALPVVDEEMKAVGVITTNDLLDELPEDMTVAQVVSPKVYTVPRYDGVHIAARVMRNHKLHHVVVTEEKRVVGILSSFDLLKLVEEHRFVMKNAPAAAKKAPKRQ